MLSLSLCFAVALLLAAACGGEGAAGDRADVTQFRDAVIAGSDLDYNPSSSPRSAVELSDLIVVGRVVDIQEARQIYDDGARERFAILEVSIERVLHGEVRGDDPTRAFVAMYVSQISGWSDIRRSVPLDRALFVLTDLVDWDYSGRLENFPEVAYFPSPDGLWFETETGKPEGIWADLADLEGRWGIEVATLDDLIGQLAAAAE